MGGVGHIRFPNERVNEFCKKNCKAKDGVCFCRIPMIRIIKGDYLKIPAVRNSCPYYMELLFLQQDE